MIIDTLKFMFGIGVLFTFIGTITGFLLLLYVSATLLVITSVLFPWYFDDSYYLIMPLAILLINIMMIWLARGAIHGNR